MKFRPITLLASVAVLASVASPAAAATKTFNFFGEITASTDPSGETDTVKGEIFRGEFSYDTEILPTTVSDMEEDMGPFTRSLYRDSAYIKLFTPLGNAFGKANIIIDKYDGSPGSQFTISGDTFSPFRTISFSTGIDGSGLPSLFTTNHGLNFSAQGTDDNGAGGKVAGTAYVTSVVDTPNNPSIPSAVPEPASWALMIGGFGMIGAAMRRRQRTTVRFA